MINWNEVDTVLLDMDGTLLDLHFDNYFWLHYLPEHYAEKHGRAASDVKQEFRDKYAEIRGTLEWYCLDYWSEVLDINIRQLKEEISERIQVRHDAGEFLIWLGQNNKQRVLITNAHPSALELKLEVTDIGDNLDQIYSSHQFGHPKETQQFWNCLSSAMEFDPNRTLFIDDTENILQSAQSFGIAHLLHINQPDLTQEKKQAEQFSSITHFAEAMNSG